MTKIPLYCFDEKSKLTSCTTLLNAFLLNVKVDIEARNQQSPSSPYNNNNNDDDEKPCILKFLDIAEKKQQK